MKIIFTLFLLISMNVFCQDKPNDVGEEQIETAIENSEDAVTDDSYWQNQMFYKKHPLNLNEANENELKELKLLPGPQVESFLRYRQLLGRLISIYELQAIPGWDVSLIKSLLPYVTVANDKNLLANFGSRFYGGSQSLLMRYGKVAEQPKGYQPPATENSNHYLGSRDALFMRYKYNYNNLLQFGIAGDKDAGEQFFKGSQKNGFDFYTVHFFAKDIGKIKLLALGDFTVNMGQGLIQWQSLAFGKSASVLNIKREAQTLRPYNSSGSYNFHRGAGCLIENKHWSLTSFISFRRLSGNIVQEEDDEHISSFQTSGYHRTSAELSDKNSMQQIAGGGSIRYKQYTWHIAANAVLYCFSKEFQKEDRPYNLYALSGKNWGNASVDYSYTYRNMHLFGEMAADKNRKFALVQGLLLSLGARADVAFLYRNISKVYQSLYSNAFTENTMPNNERGFYAGISLKPFSAIRIDAYADAFSFQWPKYLVDAPSHGKEYLVQMTYLPNKRTTFYLLYKSKTRQKSFPSDGNAAKVLTDLPQNNFRIQSSTTVTEKFTLSSRVETIWYDNNGRFKEQGFLMFAQGDFKRSKIFSGNLRLQYFETNGYNSRLYAYESDLLYNYSVPEFFDSGFRYYLNCKLNLASLLKMKKQYDVGCWLKWSQTIYSNKRSIGSGLDVITGNRRSEIKAQIIMEF
ncbi:ComEA family DNA-binding protein [Pinibacter aurantiacus]|uniref:Helix-hairpin-helix domain-containing protein n=1 Tax=Pinibacter aurantiacus TaxID=2851599 RepID=A0A9E2W8G9_9BACT|nr:helix-hairpin-helix domain-containing protein [Pinibacter aurantiacus]MBV4358172.1 helix-hairpin-helix domain-containing protein [Pinibacter aurantiacus]